MGAGLAREVGSWEGLRTWLQVPLLWVEMEHTDEKARGDFMGLFECHRSQSGDGRKGNLGQDQPSTLVHLVPCMSLFVGMLKQQENVKFLKFITVT